MVSALPWAPSFDGVAKKEANGTTYMEPFDAIDTRILEQAGRTMNCSFIYKQPDDGQWG